MPPKCQACPARDGLPCPDAGRYCDHLTDARRAQLRMIAEFRAAPRPTLPVDDRVAHGGRVVRSSILARAHNNSHSGYGQHGANFLRGLERLGYPVRIVEIDRDSSFLPLDPWVQERLTPAQDGPAVVFSVPSRPIRPGDILATMWETDRLLPNAVANCNAAGCIVVPTESNVEWFRASGVTAPIRIAPLGIDPAVFHPTTPEPEGRFVVGCAARTAHGGLRKGLADVFAAFARAFPLGDPAWPDVELRAKVWSDCEVPATDDPRVTVDRRNLTDDQVADWLRGLSVFASASKGEGWGFWTHQSLAVGRPIIATWYGATTSYAVRDAVYPVEYEIAPVPDGTQHYGGCGASWAVPDVESMVAQMRAAYRDSREGRAARGAAGAELAAAYSWERAARDLAAVLGEFGLLPAGDPPPNASPDGQPDLPVAIRPPGWFSMAKSFASAAVAHVADGLRSASPEVQAARLATCRACPSGAYDADRDSCRRCGCHGRTKRGWASSECPDGHWHAEPPDASAEKASAESR